MSILDFWVVMSRGLEGGNHHRSYFISKISGLVPQQKVSPRSKDEKSMIKHQVQGSNFQDNIY
jgi:hypothetical protein